MKGLWVECRLKGLNAEKLLNEGKKRGIILRAVKRQPGRSLLVRCERKDYPALRSLGEEKGFEVSEPRPVGALRGLLWSRGRAGLLLGAVLFLLLTAGALLFVWGVEVENAGPYEGEVRAFLRDRGIVPGAKRSGINAGEVREQLEWYLPQVKWVRVEWQGVKLKVSLEEGTPPPAIETAGKPGDVVAARDGLVTGIVTYAGTPRVKAGDFVRRGQVLIEGKEKGADGAAIPVKARGDVRARAWETAAARLPLTETVSRPTGREARRRVLTTPFFSWSPQEAPPYLTADREVTETAVGGAWVPVTLRRETYLEAALETKERNGEEALREAETLALRRLNDQLKNAETVDKWINFRMIEGDTIVVEAAGEILVQIGRYQNTAP